MGKIYILGLFFKVKVIMMEKDDLEKLKQKVDYFDIRLDSLHRKFDKLENYFSNHKHKNISRKAYVKFEGYDLED